MSAALVIFYRSGCQQLWPLFVLYALKVHEDRRNLDFIAGFELERLYQAEYSQRFTFDLGDIENFLSSNSPVDYDYSELNNKNITLNTQKNGATQRKDNRYRVEIQKTTETNKNKSNRTLY